MTRSCFVRRTERRRRENTAITIAKSGSGIVSVFSLSGVAVGEDRPGFGSRAVDSPLGSDASRRAPRFGLLELARFPLAAPSLVLLMLHAPPVVHFPQNHSD